MCNRYTMDTPIEIHAREAVYPLTVTYRVRGLRTVRFRLWLGGLVLALGAWIAGCDLEVR